MAEFIWAAFWGLVALLAWLNGAPDWAVYVPLIIGGLAVPAVVLNND